MKRTVRFVASENGQGHIVRCGALADEMRSRGWTVVDTPEPDVLILDDPAADTPAGFAGLVVRIVDLPTHVSADLVVEGRHLIRPEFCRLKWVGHEQANGVFDAREVTGLSAADLADKMAHACEVITYSGMRAMEASCVGVPMVVVTRNEGELLNAEYLSAGGRADGWGCKRAADTIEGLF